jgi:hypothetical protein
VESAHCRYGSVAPAHGALGSDVLPAGVWLPGGAEALPRRETAMDGSRFDALTQLVGGASTRRTTLRSALGAAAASTVAVVGRVALSGETDAKQRRRCKRRLRRERCQPRAAGSLCTTNEQCCTNETNRICSVAPGSSSTTLCCGGTGATCTSNENCCRHYTCVVGFCRP